MSIENIGVVAELERIGWKHEWANDNNVKCKCPFHNDNSPSAFIDVQSRKFYCQAAECNAKGDIVTFLAKALNTTRALMFQDLGTRYVLETNKIIKGEVVENYHINLKNATPLIAELSKRGVEGKLIRKYRLGESKGRITIPIKNQAGDFVNVRKYLPGAPGHKKMINTKGHGEVRLFPVDQLVYDEVVLCGGEMKAIVAAAQLNPHAIGAVTATAGEGGWDPKLTQHFKDKRVYVCMDVDLGGQKAAQTLCKLLYRVTNWIGILELPLNTDKYPKGDINDFIAQEDGELKPLLADVEEWKPKTKSIADTDTPLQVSLDKAVHADNVSKLLEVKAFVAAVDNAPYAIPKKVLPSCDKKQKCCSLCPIYNTPDNTESEIHAQSEAILELTATSKNGLRSAVMNGLGVPAICKSFAFEVTASYNAEDVRLSPVLGVSNDSSEKTEIPAICIGDGVTLNENYELTGRLWPSPINQKQTLVISDYKASQDTLSTWKADDVSVLQKFQPEEWTLESLTARMDSIYDDLEANVTRVFMRRDIHIVTDLTYHSMLWIDFDGKMVKGWTEGLVIGDSSQGKSETIVSLMDFYGLGEKTECKNVTVAGLLGGLQQMGTKWFVSWGTIPKMDRRWIFLEELKGAPISVIAHLTDMRSSGTAELPKIEKRRTRARTRILAASNPRYSQNMESYNYGVEAIQELIGASEDVRRFDIFLAVSRKDVDAAELNDLMKNRPEVKQEYTKELCRTLILWAWTRKKVVFENHQLILDKATEMSEKFSDKIPIVDRGSQRYKIARLATALAIRTFSTNDNETVVVRDCHVEYVVNFMMKCYCSQAMGYDTYSKAQESLADIKDKPEVLKKVQSLPHARDFVEQILSSVYVDIQNVQDWCDYERGSAQSLISFLVRKRALIRCNRSTYKKTGGFVGLLKKMESDDAFVEIPEFLKKERF